MTEARGKQTPITWSYTTTTACTCTHVYMYNTCSAHECVVDTPPVKVPWVCVHHPVPCATSPHGHTPPALAIFMGCSPSSGMGDVSIVGWYE